MSKELTLAKIVIINGIETLGPEFIDYYFPEIDMYLFWTECKFNTDTYTHKGHIMLHDRLIAEKNIPYVPDNKINYVTVDIKPTDKEHTYLTANRRYYHMNGKQLDFLMDMFDVDFCKRRTEEDQRAF